MHQVELKEVTKTFGPVRALVQVSGTLRGGQVSAVVGPNGSGKSTLLAIVATLMRPTSGKVDHGDLGPGRGAVRGSLGWVGHESLCYPELTGRENVELAARLHGCDATEAVEQATARFDLGPFLDRPVRTYSRGQRQRIALARALVHAPKLLLLDEPTTGLDAASTVKLTEAIRAEARGGAVVVVVTHDSGFADEVAETKIELDRGRRV